MPRCALQRMSYRWPSAHSSRRLWRRAMGRFQHGGQWDSGRWQEKVSPEACTGNTLRQRQVCFAFCGLIMSVLYLATRSCWSECYLLTEENFYKAPLGVLDLYFSLSCWRADWNYFPFYDSLRLCWLNSPKVEPGLHPSAIIAKTQFYWNIRTVCSLFLKT